MTKQEFDARIAKWGFVPLNSPEERTYEYGAISAFQGHLDPLLIALLIDAEDNPFALAIVHCTALGHKFTHVYGDTYSEILENFFNYILNFYPEAQRE